jgi:hypothetical protein
VYIAHELHYDTLVTEWFNRNLAIHVPSVHISSAGDHLLASNRYFKDFSMTPSKQSRKVCVLVIGRMGQGEIFWFWFIGFGFSIRLIPQTIIKELLLYDVMHYTSNSVRLITSCLPTNSYLAFINPLPYTMVISNPSHCVTIVAGTVLDWLLTVSIMLD